MAGKSILVLGGGVGGVVAASRLRQQLGREHRITLIDKGSKHYFSPSFLWLLLGQREPSGISRDLSRLNRKGIQFVQAEVTSIQPEAKKVVTSTGEFSYDYLVVSLGAELAPESLSGLKESAYTFYDVDNACRLRDALRDFTGGSVVVLVASTPFKCPAAPYESALLIDHHFRRKGIRGKVDMRFYTPEPQPMPVAGPGVGNAVKALLEARDIGIFPQMRPIGIEATGKEIHFEKGERAKFDLLVAIPPHRSPGVVKSSWLAEQSGWVPVDSKTLSTKYPEVYAIGDVTTIKLASGMMLPKAGVFAHGEAEVVARNIAHAINHRDGKEAFNGHGA